MNQDTPNQSWFLKERRNSDRVLLVEGKDDAIFFDAFFKILLIAGVQIINAQSKSNLKVTNIKTFLNAPADVDVAPLRMLGIVFDADDVAPEMLFKSKIQELRNKDLPVPIRNATFSELNDAHPYRLGIYIAPDPVPGRMLEDLFLSLMPEDKSFCLDEFMRCYGLDESPHLIPKQKLQLFLATKKKLKIDEIRQGIQTTVEQNLWDFSHPNLSDLKAFLLSFALDNI